MNRDTIQGLAKPGIDELTQRLTNFLKNKDFERFNGKGSTSYKNYYRQFMEILIDAISVGILNENEFTEKMRQNLMDIINKGTIDEEHYYKFLYYAATSSTTRPLLIKMMTQEYYLGIIITQINTIYSGLSPTLIDAYKQMTLEYTKLQFNIIHFIILSSKSVLNDNKILFDILEESINSKLSIFKEIVRTLSLSPELSTMIKYFKYKNKYLKLSKT